jgi:Mg-chelatase subunit ChlD
MALPASAQSSNNVAPIKSKTSAKKTLPAPDIIVPVISPTRVMTTNIAFIIDTSGSMDTGGRVGMALTFAWGILGRGGDQLQVALFSFKNTHTRWPGLTAAEKVAAKSAGSLDEPVGKGPLKGWVFFPGVPQLASAQKWLNERGTNGGTNPTSALIEALAEKVKHLTIVLITDGEEFDIPAFKKAVADGQAEREKKELGKATIFVIGTGKSAAKQQHLIDVGKSEGGGLFVIEKPEPPLSIPLFVSPMPPGGIPDDIDDWLDRDD